ncbi:MAG: P1 family peptidase [Pyrinomonadaceae bacterium]
MNKVNILPAVLIFCLSAALFGQTKPRARDLGIPFDGETGKYNAITDVPGVEVGYSTIIRGSGKWSPGKGPVRTGVTIVLPRGKESRSSYPVGYFIFNGDGEMTGIPYVHDYGISRLAIGITNTNSVGVVRDAIGEWNYAKFADPKDPYTFAFGLPLVGETWDGVLNDINGYHVKKEHTFEAIESARSGPIAEGNVGGGTAMNCLGFKCGTGTSSRVIEIGGVKYTVGVIVQANFGTRDNLLIAGIPVGREIKGYEPVYKSPTDGSIIAIVGTDAPLNSSKLNLVAKRVTLGLARTGSIGSSGSGDIFIAFSTARGDYDEEKKLTREPSIDSSFINPVFQATVEATEEAIINAMIAAEDMEGINGNKVFAIPHDQLKTVLKKYGRLNK